VSRIGEIVIVFNSSPSWLLSNDGVNVVYEGVIVTSFDEEEIIKVVNNPLVIIPSNNQDEKLEYIGGIARFVNTGDRLTDGSDLILKFGTVLSSGPIPNLFFLGQDGYMEVPSTNPPEDTTGIPLTLVSNAEYVFEGGSKGSRLIFTAYYRLTMWR
jgi:hypothetical protein